MSIYQAPFNLHVLRIGRKHGVPSAQLVGRDRMHPMRRGRRLCNRRLAGAPRIGLVVSIPSESPTAVQDRGTQVNCLVDQIEAAVFSATGTHVFRNGLDGSYAEAGSAIALLIDAAIRAAIPTGGDIEWGFGSALLAGSVIPVATEAGARAVREQSYRLRPVYYRTAAGPWVLDTEPTGVTL